MALKANRSILDCSEQCNVFMLNEMDKVHNMHCGHYNVAAGKWVMNIKVRFCCPACSLFLAGLNDVFKQKENAQSHCRGMHDTGYTNHRLAALRYHNEK